MKDLRAVIPTLEGLLELDRKQYFTEGRVMYRKARREGGYKIYSHERAYKLFQEWKEEHNGDETRQQQEPLYGG